MNSYVVLFVRDGLFIKNCLLSQEDITIFPVEGIVEISNLFKVLVSAEGLETIKGRCQPIHQHKALRN
jgi:hypothetical protein